MAAKFDNVQFDNYTLRLLTRNDLQAYYALIDSNRKRLEDFFAGTVAMTQTIEDTDKHLEDVVSKCDANCYFPFVIEDNDTGKMVASLQVKSIDWSIPKAELGYYIDGKYEGKGLVSGSIAHIIRYCFAQQQFNKLYIRTHHSNTGSIKVAEKNGFTMEGTIRRDYKTTKGVLIDTMYFGLLREEWEERNN